MYLENMSEIIIFIKGNNTSLYDYFTMSCLELFF